MKNNNKNNNRRKQENTSGKKGRRIRGNKGVGRGRGKVGLLNSKKITKNKIEAQPHRLEGIYIIKSDKELLATKNLCPGEIIYGEELVTIEEIKEIEIHNNSESEKDFSSDSEIEVIQKNSLNNRNVSNIQNIQNKLEYRIWDTFYSKLGAAIETGISNIYMKPGSKVLYLGAGNDSYSTISHISDLVGKEGVVYAVEKSEIKGLVLKTLAKKRINIKPIIYDAKIPFNYKNSIINLVDCIFANISEKDITIILAKNAEFFLKSKGGFICVINANQNDSKNKSQKEKIDEQIRLLKENSLYVKEYISLDNFESGFAVVSGLFKPYRDYLDEEDSI